MTQTDAAWINNDLVPDWRLLSCKITFFLKEAAWMHNNLVPGWMLLKEAAGINNDLVPDLRLHG